jgi:outer membrane protein assembly factor BamB
VPSALDAGEGRVLIVGGYELGTAMIKVENKADGSYSVKELFRHNDFGDQTKPPILYNGYFYGQFSTNSKKDGLACMNMDGKVMWKTGRSPLFDKGSMILVDGLILATDGATKLYLIEPNPSGFKPLASAELLKGGGATINWAPLALADGKLLIRDQSRLMCVKIAK